jgi:hypothetical protein
MWVFCVRFRLVEGRSKASKFLFTKASTIPTLKALESAGGSMRSIVALSMLGLVLPVAGLAQNPMMMQGPRMGGAGGGQVVTGQPFSVIEKVTRTETLGDGTKIVHRTEEQRWRDAQGRLRTQSAEVQANGEVVFHRTEIFDPATRTMMMLQLDKKTAMVMHMPERNGEHRQWPEDATGERVKMSMPDVQVKTVDLPGKTVAGVYGVGTRTTRVRPAGSIGNDHEIVSTSDRYESPDLKILLYSSLDDPREKMVREVTSLSRTDPDAAMFEVPKDFTVKEMPQRQRRDQ